MQWDITHSQPTSTSQIATQHASIAAHSGIRGDGGPRRNQGEGGERGGEVDGIVRLSVIIIIECDESRE